MDLLGYTVFYFINMKASRNEILFEILEVLGIIGVIAVTLIIPNFAVVLKPYMKNKRKFSKGQINKSLYNMEKRGLIKIYKNSIGNTEIKLQPSGKRLYKFSKIKKAKIRIPPKWDGKYRFVIFDISNDNNYVRKIFRGYLKRLGFRQLQKSVWIIPYPCKEEIEIFISYYFLTKYVKLLTVENIDPPL